mmetsp:Transcript_14122/g.48592  ORF Transcript_14122/g.48592 Transcript_14122/m.48592 type:complete len:342 (+) Transcript_14122:1147-2172(+)
MHREYIPVPGLRLRPLGLQLELDVVAVDDDEEVRVHQLERHRREPQLAVVAEERRQRRELLVLHGAEELVVGLLLLLRGLEDALELGDGLVHRRAAVRLPELGAVRVPWIEVDLVRSGDVGVVVLLVPSLARWKINTSALLHEIRQDLPVSHDEEAPRGVVVLHEDGVLVLQEQGLARLRKRSVMLDTTRRLRLAAEDAAVPEQVWHPALQDRLGRVLRVDDDEVVDGVAVRRPRDSNRRFPSLELARQRRDQRGFNGCRFAPSEARRTRHLLDARVPVDEALHLLLVVALQVLEDEIPVLRLLLNGALVALHREILVRGHLLVVHEHPRDHLLRTVDDVS